MRHTTPFALLTLASCAPSGGIGVDDKCATCSGEAETRAILALVNDPATTFEVLDILAALDSDAAGNIIDHRDGLDRESGTSDDDLFDTLDELDQVPQVGPTALDRLLAYAIAAGYLDAVSGEPLADVIFSPQAYDASHLQRVKELIEGAEHSLDIAMYSFSDAEISESLAAAVGRGVDVRFIFETAYEDRKATDPWPTKSGKLEADGINVRYVNKIMHHKFVIVDGPRDDAARAATARIASGSGNWSYSAGVTYDENTLFLSGIPEMSLRLQSEFDLLWEHSRDFVADTTLPYDLSTLEVTEGNVQDVSDVHAWFTSANFKLSGTTFSKDSTKNTVADAWVDAIEAADTSIWIASGHLRSRPISEALMAKKAANPSMDIRVYLDGQEYISDSSHEAQVDDLDACVAAATSESKRLECYDKGFYFSYTVSEDALIPLRFKYYAYKWDYTYAKQMHHKYMIVDGDTVYTGSYNLSDNAEHNTFENMMMFTGPTYAALASAYVANFESMWATGDGLYDDLLAEVETASTIPLVFEPMALTWTEVNALKSAIYENCPSAYEDHWYTSSTGYRCTR